MDSSWLPPGAAPPPSQRALPEFLTVLSLELQDAAVDLRPLGPSEVAWPFASALDAVNAVTAKGYAVLGGDVWVRTPEGAIEPAYENWHADRQAGESWEAYAERAKLHAIDRMSVIETGHTSGNSTTALYVLVCAAEARHDRLTADR
jgi:hypothetical protein